MRTINGGGFGQAGQRQNEVATRESEFERVRAFAFDIALQLLGWLACVLLYWPLVIGPVILYLAAIGAGLVTCGVMARVGVGVAMRLGWSQDEAQDRDWQVGLWGACALLLALWWIFAGGDWLESVAWSWWLPVHYSYGGGRVWIACSGGSFSLPGWFVSVQVFLALAPLALLWPSVLLIYRFTIEIVLPNLANITFRPASPASVPTLLGRLQEKEAVEQPGLLNWFTSWLRPVRTSSTTIAQAASAVALTLPELRKLYEHYHDRAGAALKIGDGVRIPGITQARLREIRDALLEFTVETTDGPQPAATREHAQAATYVTAAFLAWAEVELEARPD